nr:hypothetical protein [Tanacetum cinerariifolium]
MAIDQQVALDEALVPHASRLRIGKSNFRLRSDITSKESTLQVVYDVLRLTPFYKAFLVTVDVLEIYMQEFWATAIVHHHSIRFKMNNKKRIVNLEYFREMLYICPRIPNQTFNELPFVEEILAFLRYLGHNVYNDQACLETSEHMTVRCHVDEDIRNSVAYKEYYAIASGVAPPKMKESVRNTQSSSDTTMPPPTAAGTRLSTSAKGKQPAKSSKAKGFDVPTDESDEEISWKSSDEDDDDDDQIEADDDGDDQEDEDEQDEDDQDDNDDDQDSDNDGDDFVHPKLSTHDEEAKDEESFDLIVQTPSQVENSDDESNDDESHGMDVGGEEEPDAEDDDEELYRDVNINLKGRDVQMRDVHTTQVLEDTHVTLTLVNPDGQQQSSSMSSQFVTSMFNPSSDAGIDSLFETTHMVDVLVSITVVPLPVTAPTLPPPSIPIMSQVQQAPTLTPTTAPSSFLHDLPNFGSLFGFDHRLKTLEANFSEFMQTNQFAEAVSSILGIIDRYIDHRMNEAVKVAVQLQSDRLRDEAQAENKDFINKLDEYIQKIIKEQVKIQVSKILPKIEKTVNEQLEAEILIEKMESNKSIHRSDEQRNLYKAMVDAYECDKIILDTYGDTVMLKRRHDDADKDEEPSAGSDRGSKRRREGKEPESTSAPKEKAYKTTGKSTEGSKSHQKTASESKQTKPPTPDRAWNKTLSATHGSIQPWIRDLAKQADSHASFNEMMDTHVDFSAFLMNRLNVDTLTPELLAGPTYELMKGSCKSLVELEFFLEEVYKAKTDQLDWNNPEGQQYPHNLLKPLPLIPNSRGRHKTKASHYGHIKWIEDLVPRTMWSQAPASYDKYALWGISHWGRKGQQFYGFAVNSESARDVYSKRRIIAVTELQIVEWHDYKHLDWITVRRDDDKLYKFKKGDFKRLRIQDIEDMLLLLVQGKLTNLTVEERFAFNVSLRMFMRSIVIQRHVEDLQLGVESYQKKLNLTKPDTYKTDLKRNETYTAYSNPRGFIYQKKTSRKDDSYAENLVKEILFKLNLPDHRTLKDGGECICFQLSQIFITTCSYPTIKYKDIMKAQVRVSKFRYFDTASSSSKSLVLVARNLNSSNRMSVRSFSA